VQNIKIGHSALDIAENDSSCAKHEKLDLMPLVPHNMSLGAQNMETGPGALDIANNAKHENWTPTVPPKTGRGAQNMKTGPCALGTTQNMKNRPDALGNVQNMSGSAKYLNWT
jgi:hypothetical protein